MMIYNFLFVLIFLFQASCVFAQEKESFTPLCEQNVFLFQEKLHLHTDRDHYLAGDTVWLRAHCVDARSHRPVAESRYVYVELHDDEGKLARRIKLLARDGRYAGYLPLPADAGGDYALVAYTLFMANQGSDYFFKKPISVAPLRPDAKVGASTERRIGAFDVQFFPEGGYLIDDIRCRVAFKALADDGLSVEVEGVIRNARGEVVDSIRSLHAGMGCAAFTPRDGERYYAECSIPSGQTRRFELPATDNDACVLRVLSEEERFTVQVLARRPLPEGLSLALLCRGNLLYRETWEPQRPALVFEREGIPGGVLQLLLLDAEGNALSERLLFNRSEERARVSLAAAGERAPRRKQTLTVEVRNPDGSPAEGDFSLSVTDRAAVPRPEGASICATLLLTSELRGYIEDPDWYFDSAHAAAETALDALLMTQGWRRYDVPALLRGERPALHYPLEAGQEIAGRINKGGIWNRKHGLNRYEVQLLAPQWGYVTSAPVAEDGTFALNGFDFPDSTTFVLRPVGRSGPQRNAYITLTRDSFPEVGELPKRMPEPEEKPYEAQAREYVARRGSTDLRNVTIDTVFVVHHRRDENPEPEHRLASHSWNEQQIKDSGSETILDFLQRLPGVYVRGSHIWYHDKVPAFLINGHLDESIAMLENPMGGINYFNKTGQNIKSRKIIYADDYESLPTCLFYPLALVKSIEFIPGGNSVIWGPGLPNNGIFSITLKKSYELERSFLDESFNNSTLISPIGYQTPSEFYSPSYPTIVHRLVNTPDYRLTIYWNSQLELNKRGQVLVEFYSSDTSSKYDAVIYGVTKDGKIIQSSLEL
ncbi:hypothetical protein [Alistipes communis]|uniref:hypothetical protein n=1 Tax=Alistipes communis TaxID=2585118 RepID=UPI0022E44760|nr:hypothetical protein [Alistipes communis]